MDKSSSRVVNVARNAVVSLLCQAAALLVQFAARAVFVRTLGRDYLGISGLFSNVLTVLSFAELGIGNALIFSMYKPLAQGDTEKLKSLMALYKKAYRYIGLFIAGAGMCMIPFLRLVIREAPAVSENLVLLYCLYLFNSVSSYFFAYKKSILTADQRLYIVNLYHQLINVAQVLMQIVVLLLTHNFLLYLIIQLVFTICTNVATAWKANRMYPFLRESAQPLSVRERRDIFRNVKALTAYRLGSTVLNGTDNILVTALFSVGDVALVSNYVMIHAAFTTVLGRITEAFTASVGNLNVSADPQQQYAVFRKMFFLCAWMFGFASVGLLLLIDDVIILWVGREYLLPFSTVVALTLSFYVSSMQYTAYSFRTTSGLFVEGRFAPIAAAIANIVLSVVLGRCMGLCGVFFATSISRFFTISVTDGILVYKKRFGQSPTKYFAMYVSYIVLFTALYFGLRWIVERVSLGGVLGVGLKILIVTVLFNLFMIAAFGRTWMFRELRRSLEGLCRKQSNG